MTGNADGFGGIMSIFQKKKTPSPVIEDKKKKTFSSIFKRNKSDHDEKKKVKSTSEDILSNQKEIVVEPTKKKGFKVKNSFKKTIRPNAAPMENTDGLETQEKSELKSSDQPKKKWFGKKSPSESNPDPKESPSKKRKFKLPNVLNIFKRGRSTKENDFVPTEDIDDNKESVSSDVYKEHETEAAVHESEDPVYDELLVYDRVHKMKDGVLLSESYTLKEVLDPLWMNRAAWWEKGQPPPQRSDAVRRPRRSEYVFDENAPIIAAALSDGLAVPWWEKRN